MKSGISLVDMAKEIQRQADLKADYMLDTRSLRLEPFDSKLYLNAYDQSGVPALEPLEVNSIAHRQIGTHLKIPAAYGSLLFPSFYAASPSHLTTNRRDTETVTYCS